MTSTARVSLTPGKSVVSIDDQELQHVARSITISGAAGEFPTVALELIIPEITADIQQARARVGPETRDALLALGWTPPSGD